MPKTALKTEKFQMMASPDWLTKVDDYGYANRIRSRAEAVRVLVDRGLEALPQNAERPGAPTPDRSSVKP